MKKSCIMLVSTALFFPISACENRPTSSMPTPLKDSYTLVSLPRSDFSREFAKRTGFIRDSSHTDQFLFGYLKESVYAKLNPELRNRMSELDPVAFAHGTSQLKELSLALAPFTGREWHVAPQAPEPYHTYETLTDELKFLAASHPDLFELSSVGKTAAGREIWMVKVSDNPTAEEAEPKLFYVSTMHGNEVVGQEMLVYLLRLIADNHDTNPRIQNLVSHAQIYLIPNMNPDGTAARTRFNSQDVDLNRNFPDFVEDPVDTPENRAPETQAIMELLKKNRMESSLSFHGGSACINLPWDAIPNDTPEKRYGESPLLLSMSHEYAEANGRMTQENSGNFDRGVTFGWEWYETHGNLPDWATYYRDSPTVTIELSQVKWPDAAELPQFWSENREPLLAYLENSLRGIALDVIGPNGEHPLVHVSLDGSTRVTTATGPLFRPALPGVRHVRIQAQGYKTLEIDRDVGRFQENYFPVVLEPEATRL